MSELTQDALKSALSYDPESGVFRWAVSGPGRRSGAVGSWDKHGYLTVRLGGKSYKCHRLAWLWMTGSWPAGDIDHINGVRSDNRWANLRDVDRGRNLQNNMRNTSGRPTKTGYMGVYPSKGGKFEAALSINNKKVCVGRFSTIEEAVAAHRAAKARLHPGCLVAP